MPFIALKTSFNNSIQTYKLYALLVKTFVKVREIPQSHCCVFLVERTSAQSVYTNRPM